MEKEYYWNIMKCPKCGAIFAIPTYDFEKYVDDDYDYEDIRCFNCNEKSSIQKFNQGTMLSNRGLEVKVVRSLSKQEE